MSKFSAMTRIEEAINQPRFKSDYHKMMVNLLYTSNWLRDRQMKIFRPYGILPQHFNIMRILKGRDPKPASAGEIKEVMLDKAPDLTRLVDKLVHLELVDRRLCPENRRRMEIFLTDKGRGILQELNMKVNAMEKEYSRNLTSEEAAKCSELLDKLRG